MSVGDDPLGIPPGDGDPLLAVVGVVVGPLEDALDAELCVGLLDGVEDLRDADDVVPVLA